MLLLYGMVLYSPSTHFCFLFNFNEGENFYAGLGSCLIVFLNAHIVLERKSGEFFYLTLEFFT
jgi:hypothetical protein